MSQGPDFDSPRVRGVQSDADPAAPRRWPSPCISVCRIDDGSGLCVGCMRTLDEIANWARMSERQKGAVWGAIQARRARARGARPDGG
ncbi:MAG: DUF1289 domain-containing protein [Burkholderiales bacterium]|nr:MAG: DUF1289 domain-containing protein [Burkholderiales bacterium]